MRFGFAIAALATCIPLCGGLTACESTSDVIGQGRLLADAGTSLPPPTIPTSVRRDAGPDLELDAAPSSAADAAPPPSLSRPDAATVKPGDVLTEIGFPQEDSQDRIAAAFDQLFFGDPDTQAIYREVGDDAAYIEDILNRDVRTDAIGYGMFVAVQLDEQVVFDKLWTWAKRNMLLTEPPRAGLLAWRCTSTGQQCESAAATDATSIIATSLYLAREAWQDTGKHPYQDDADMLVDAMVQTEARNGGPLTNVQNPFDVVTMLPRKGSFVPDDPYLQTDFLMPAFYDYWSERRTDDSEFWSDAADASGELMRSAVMANSGLIPYEIDATGRPAPGTIYDEVAARTLLNRWFSNSWMGSSWVAEQNRVLLDFFLEQDEALVSSYFLDGDPRGDRNTPAHIALSATAAATTGDVSKYGVFLQELVDTPIPDGPSRYYQGMLYLIAFMAVSGNIEVGGP